MGGEEDIFFFFQFQCVSGKAYCLYTSSLGLARDPSQRGTRFYCFGEKVTLYCYGCLFFMIYGVSPRLPLKCGCNPLDRE